MTKFEHFDYEHEAQADSWLSRLLAPLQPVTDFLALICMAIWLKVWELIYGQD